MKDFNNTAANVGQVIVAIDALVQTSASKAYIVRSNAAQALPIGVQNASYQGQDAASIRVAVDDAELENYVASAGSFVEVVELPGSPAARAALIAKWAKKSAKKNKNALLPLLLLPLAACGGSDSDSNPTGVVSASELNTLDAARSAVVDASAVTEITGAASDVNTALTSAGITGLGDEAVTLDDTTLAAATLNTLDGNTTGTVDATTVTTLTGTASDVNTALTSAGITGLGDEAVTLSDTTLVAATLNTLDGNTTGAIDATTVTTLTGTAADIAAVIAAHNASPSTITLDGDYTVTITGDVAATVDQLVAINNDTSGTITLNSATNSASFSDTADNLTSAFDGVTSLTGTVVVTTQPTLAQLVAINNATAGAITLNVTAADLSGSAEDLIAALDGTITTYAGNLVVVGTASKEQIEILVTKTSGSLTATLEDNTGGLITLDLDAGGAATSTTNNITLGDGLVNVTGGVAADNITLGDGANTLNLGDGVDTVVGTDVTANGDTINTGDGDDTVTINKDNGATFSVNIDTGAGDDDIEINDGAVDSADAVTMVGGDDSDTLTITGTNNFTGSAAYVGIETVLIRSDVTFTLDQIAAVRGNIAVHPDQFKVNPDDPDGELVVTGSHIITVEKTSSDTASSVELTNLTGVTGVTVGANVSVEISPTAAAALAVSATTAGVSFVDATSSVIVSEAAKESLSTVAISVAGSPVVSLPYAIKNTVEIILAADTDYIADATSVTVTDAVTIEQFNTLDLLTGADIVLTGGISDTAANLSPSAVNSSGFAAAVVQDTDVAVTITGTNPTVAELNAIAGSTTGVVTATISGDIATLSALTTAATAAITITVTDAVTVAQFNTLDAATSTSIVLTGGISDTAANLSPAGVNSVGFAAATTQDTDVAVTVTGTNPSVDELSAILGATTGLVTATISGDIATLVTLADASEINALTISVSDTSADAADLIAVDAITSVAVDARTVETITGTVEELVDYREAFTAKTITGLSLYTAVTEDTAASAADLLALADPSTGFNPDVDLTSIETIDGAASDIELLYALQNDDASVSNLGDEAIDLTDAGSIAATVLTD